eukprot:jgi/Mesen1/7317/ME000376S06480
MDRKSSPSVLENIFHLTFKSKSFGDNEGGDLPPPPPTREVRPSEAVDLKPFETETISLQRGLTLLRGTVNTSQILGTSNTDLVPGKYEGGLKLWECTIDLIETLRREMQDGHLQFRGKDVLELGCGHGLPGVVASIKGASRVHFQDFNEEVLLNLTIPNVEANLEAARTRLQSLQSLNSKASGSVEGGDQPVTPRSPLPDCEFRYFAGDWGTMDKVLSLADRSRDGDIATEKTPEVVVETEGPMKVGRHSLADDSSPPAVGVAAGPGTGSETSAREGEHGQEAEANPLAYHRVLSGVPSFYTRTEEEPVPGGGYDIILMSETLYSLASLPKLLELILKTLRRPYGVVYVGGKKHYFGVGGGTRAFKSLVEEDGRLHSHLVADFVDGSSNVREIWKFFFK